jgi:hypothetical protein
MHTATAAPCRGTPKLCRRRSIHRRRLLASSGPLPPQLAAHFTTSEQAVLRVIGDEANRNGIGCYLCNAAIAARAGTSVTVVQNTKRLARRLGLISVEERRIGRHKSRTSVIRVISLEWAAWLRHHCANATRKRIDDTYRNVCTTDTEVQEASLKHTKAPPLGAYDPLHRALERFGGAIKGMPSLSG